MGHGHCSQKTRLRRLKSIELLRNLFEFLVGGAWPALSEDVCGGSNQFLTKAIEFLASGAWPALSEDTSAEAQIIRTLYENKRILCQRGMASALIGRVCGGSNQ